MFKYREQNNKNKEVDYFVDTILKCNLNREVSILEYWSLNLNYIHLSSDFFEINFNLLMRYGSSKNMNAKTFCQDMKVQLCNVLYLCQSEFCFWAVLSVLLLFTCHVSPLNTHTNMFALPQPISVTAIPSFEWIIACLHTLRFINFVIIIIIIFIITMYLFNNEHNLLDFNLLLSNEPLIYIFQMMAGWPVFKDAW